MRNATAYGASPRLRLDVVLNNLVGWAYTTGRIRILSDGTPWRPLVHVQDIARATRRDARGAPRSSCTTRRSTSAPTPRTTRLRSSPRSSARRSRTARSSTPGSGDPDPRSYRVDFGKVARSLPELEFRWTAKAGAVELADAYHAAGLTFEDFDGSRYTRVKRLKRLLAAGALDDDLRPVEGWSRGASHDARPRPDRATLDDGEQSLPACRFCGAALRHTVVDLGMSPLCESFLARRAARRDGAVLSAPRPRLRAAASSSSSRSTSRPSEIFTEYAYFSSYSDSWVEHARDYAETMIERFELSRPEPRRRGREQRRLPAAALRRARHPGARDRARPPTSPRRPRSGASRPSSSSSASSSRTSLAAEGRRADLIAANNVLAQVPDLNDFVAGLRILLAPDGVVTIEFPHLLRLIDENQFDTIYHEHFSYFSLDTAVRDLRRARPPRLRRRGAADARRLAADLRLPRREPRAPGDRAGSRRWPSASALAGYRTLAPYADFGERVEETKRTLLEFLIDATPRGQDGRRLRRPGQGQHAAQLLRHPHRLPRLHRRPQPVQAGPVPARHAHPDLRPRAGSRRRGPTTS